MKIVHYFLGFNSFALSYWLFDTVICSPDTDVYSWVSSCIAFSILSSTSAYNIIQGYKLHKKEA